MKRCNCCGRKRDEKKFREYTGKSGNKLIRGNCIECERDLRKIRDANSSLSNDNRKIRRKKYRSTLKGRFVNARQQARKRKVAWALTREQYIALISNSCFYCGGFFPPVKCGIGLDRKNPKQGYIVGNVVACDETCNKIKNNFLTVDETKSAIKAIIKIRKANVKLKK